MGTEVTTLSERLANEGFVEFRNVVSAETIRAINSRIDLYRGGRVGYSGLVDDQPKELVEMLRQEGPFREVEVLARQITRRTTKEWFGGLEPVASDLYVLRCVDSKGERVSNLRHFDSHYMTLLVPVRLANASSPDNGDLIIYPLPSLPSSSAANFARKIVNKIDQVMSVGSRRQRTESALRSGVAKTVTAKVGSVYFFNGFVTKHCNRAVAGGERRSLLLHDYAPDLSFGVAESLVHLRRWITRETL